MFTSDKMERNVNVPEGVTIEIDRMKLAVKGPKGSLHKDFGSPLFGDMVRVEKNGRQVKVATEGTKRKLKSDVGTVAAGIENMVHGVTL